MTLDPEVREVFTLGRAFWGWNKVHLCVVDVRTSKEEVTYKNEIIVFKIRNRRSCGRGKNMTILRWQEQSTSVVNQHFSYPTFSTGVQKLLFKSSCENVIKPRKKRIHS